jgi:RND family efflux transporter MFP subunit
MNALRPLLLFPALALLACKESTPPPSPPPAPVTVVQPKKQEVTVFSEFPATLEANNAIEIRARVSGILRTKNFTEGGTVEEGQLLFEIEPDTYQQALKAAQADLTRAEAGRELAQKRFEKLEQASRKNAVAEIDVDVAAAELSQAAASVDQAQAQLENARLQLAYTRIEAPVSGRISLDLAGVGNLVGPGQETLLTRLIDDSQVFAYFEVPEREVIRFLEARANQDAARLVMEKPIGLRLADGSLYQKPGRIDFIDNAVDPQTRTIRVRAVFENPQSTLAAGLYGLVRVPVGPNPAEPSQKEALTIPSVAVQRDIAGPFVWTVDETNTVRRTEVKTGREVDASLSGGTRLSVILEGLTGDQRVIVAGLQRAREGAVVAPTLAPAEAEPPNPPSAE